MLYPFDFFCQCFCKDACRFPAVHIVQEVFDVCIHNAFQSLGIEKNLCSAVAKQQMRYFKADVSKSIYAFVHAKRIKGADKDDIGLSELIVIDALAQEIHVDHSLIVSRSLHQFIAVPLGCLHLNVIDRAAFIFHIYVETYRFAVETQVDAFLCMRVVQFSYFDVQDAFNQALAEVLVLHDALKDEVVADG